eukprot:TRINITY_DN27216_c0_g1_i1.p1 TRINITY_DN27216_c0_g1~~TRINITY_DN27216_c0_g1_i1.p1  ORF type:complete len:215 (+),score=48.42 TRINITY_DN27216_c0_g1_i1:166-810(+)
MQRGLVGSEMCIRDSINAEYMEGMPTQCFSKCIKQYFEYNWVRADVTYCFEPKLAEGVHPVCHDFPSLTNLHVISYKMIPITIREKTFESMELKIDEIEIDQLEYLFNRPVYIGYPFQQEAIITTVITKSEIYVMNRERKVEKQPFANAKKEFDNAIKKANSKQLVFVEPKFVCYCSTLDLSLIHISEPTRPLYISYAVFCLKKKKKITQHTNR